MAVGKELYGDNVVEWWADLQVRPGRGWGGKMEGLRRVVGRPAGAAW